MLTPGDLRAALGRILASEGFRNAERLTRFLRFIVERALAGQSDQIKEYLLGSEVYDRGAGYDPRTDPIVRVEARRLRARLQEYYEGPGRHDPIRITLPKGGYVPEFSAAPAPPPPARRSRHWLALAVVALATAAGVLTFGFRAGSNRTTLVVIPHAENSDRAFADGLAETISAELARHPALRVVAWPLFVDYRQRHGGDPAGSVERTASNLRAEAVLFLSIRRADQRRRVTAHLMKPEQGWKRWAGSYERGLNDELAVQRELARAIAAEAAAAMSLPR